MGKNINKPFKTCCNHNQQSFGNIWQSYRNDNHHSSDVAVRSYSLPRGCPYFIPITPTIHISLNFIPQVFPIRYPIRNQPDAIGFFTNQSNNHSKKPFLFPRDIITKTPSSNSLRSLRSLRSSYPNIATEHGTFSSMIYHVFSFKKGVKSPKLRSSFLVSYRKRFPWNEPRKNHSIYVALEGRSS